MSFGERETSIDGQIIGEKWDSSETGSFDRFTEFTSDEGKQMMSICRSAIGIVVLLLLSPFPVLGDEGKGEEGKADEKTKQAVNAFLKAAREKDVSALMKTVALPWLDETEGVIKDEKKRHSSLIPTSRSPFVSLFQGLTISFDARDWTKWG